MPAETHSHREVDAAEVRRVVFEHARELIGAGEADLATPLPEDAVAVCDLIETVAEELAERGVGLGLDEEIEEWTTLGDVVDHLVDVLGAADRGAEDDLHLSELQERIGYHFDDVSLLRQALQHRSYVAENGGTASNERLEFLGDAVLGMVVTDALYRRWPGLAEGALAKARAAVVSSEYLAGRADRYDIGRHLYLGKGEHQSGGREKPSILADAIEAVIGAVYLDGDIDSARSFVLRLVGEGLDDAVTGEGHKDFKTRLQELSAQSFSRLPTYAVESFGPDHAKEFHARVFLDGEVAGEGRGRSKKQAEQAAARQAWELHGPRSSAVTAGAGPSESSVDRQEGGDA